MKPLFVTGLAAILTATTAIPSFAQPVISAKSGLLSLAQGSVFLNGQPVENPTTRFPDIKEKDVVRTEDGRAEVLLTPGVTLRLGENSSLRMISNRLIDTRVELVSGSAVVEADDIAKDTGVTIVDKEGTIALTKAGLYRFDTEPARVKVFKGVASVAVKNAEPTEVSSGKMLSVNGELASAEKFNTEDTDALDRWSHRQASAMAMANASAAKSLVGSSYLPIGWGNSGCFSAWGYNAYYGMMTYLPCNGMLYSPYGYSFWSPYLIGQRYWVNPPAIFGGGGGRTTVASSSSGSASLARPTASRSTAAIGGFAGGGGHGVRGAMGAYGPSNASNASAGSFSGARGGGFSGSAAPSGGGFSGGGGGGGGVSAGGGGGGGAAGHGGGGGGGGHH